MTSTLDLSEDDRKKLYEALAGLYIAEVEKGTLKEKDRMEISQEVIAGVDGLKTKQDQDNFLKKLAKKYTFFRPLMLTNSEDEIKEKEKAVIERLQKYIQQ